MSSEREYEHYITPHDRVDITVDVEHGTVVDFTANYRARIQGQWIEVLRYDTAHGHLHVHRFWRDPPHQIEELEDPSNPKGRYGLDLTQAEKDLVENWRSYRSLMETRIE